MSCDYQNDYLLIKNAFEITIAARVSVPKHSQIEVAIYINVN